MYIPDPALNSTVRSGEASRGAASCAPTVSMLQSPVTRRTAQGELLGGAGDHALQVGDRGLVADAADGVDRRRRVADALPQQDHVGRRVGAGVAPGRVGARGGRGRGGFRDGPPDFNGPRSRCVLQSSSVTTLY